MDVQTCRIEPGTPERIGRFSPGVLQCNTGAANDTSGVLHFERGSRVKVPLYYCGVSKFARQSSSVLPFRTP